MTQSADPRPETLRWNPVLRRNNVRISGVPDGPTLVFAHGFGCDQTLWRFVAPHFEESCRVVLFDHVGAGGSDLSAYQSRKYATLDGYARDINEIADALELRDAVFIGHSVAAMFGVLAQIARPDQFDRLVLVGPSPRYIDEGSAGYRGGFSEGEVEELLDALASNYLGWSAATAPAFVGRPDRPELGEELVSSFCRTDPAIAEEFARATFLSDNREDLASVTARCLVLQVADDFVAPLEVGQFVADRLPHSELVILDTVGHLPHLTVPDEVVGAIRNFLDRT